MSSESECDLLTIAAVPVMGIPSKYFAAPGGVVAIVFVGAAAGLIVKEERNLDSFGPSKTNMDMTAPAVTEFFIELSELSSVAQGTSSCLISL